MDQMAGVFAGVGHKGAANAYQDADDMISLSRESDHISAVWPATGHQQEANATVQEAINILESSTQVANADNKQIGTHAAHVSETAPKQAAGPVIPEIKLTDKYGRPKSSKRLRIERRELKRLLREAELKANLQAAQGSNNNAASPTLHSRNSSCSIATTSSTDNSLPSACSIDTVSPVVNSEVSNSNNVPAIPAVAEAASTTASVNTLNDTPTTNTVEEESDVTAEIPVPAVVNKESDVTPEIPVVNDSEFDLTFHIPVPTVVEKEADTGYLENLTSNDDENKNDISPQALVSDQAQQETAVDHVGSPSTEPDVDFSVPGPIIPEIKLTDKYGRPKSSKRLRIERRELKRLLREAEMKAKEQAVKQGAAKPAQVYSKASVSPATNSATVSCSNNAATPVVVDSTPKEFTDAAMVPNVAKAANVACSVRNVNDTPDVPTSNVSNESNATPEISFGILVKTECEITAEISVCNVVKEESDITPEPATRDMIEEEGFVVVEISACSIGEKKSDIAREAPTSDLVEKEVNIAAEISIFNTVEEKGDVFPDSPISSVVDNNKSDVTLEIPDGNVSEKCDTSPITPTTPTIKEVDKYGRKKSGKRLRMERRNLMRQLKEAETNKVKAAGSSNPNTPTATRP